jgi:hypothetical protein
VGWARAVTLKGDSVVLEPLRAAHHDDLVEAVRDGELWNLWYTSVPAPEGMAAAMNRQSQAAIERLGARLDGILRNHSHHRNGTLRDTYVYSMTADEWPGVRARLQQRLATAGSSSFG